MYGVDGWLNGCYLLDIPITESIIGMELSNKVGL